jgi:hypothetical protein
MTNVYGNTVTINLPPTPVKTTEQIVSTLPNTGPGASMVTTIAITIIAAFFFTRSRLLSKETAIALNNNAAGGAA